jgi:hypothetical protein
MDTVTETGRTAIAGLAAVDDASVVADAVVEAGRTAIALKTPIGDKVAARPRPAMMTGGGWAMMSVPFHAAFIGRAAALSPGVVARTGHSHA